MKKAIAISLLGVMLYNIAGYYAVFNVLHVQVKKQVWKLQKTSVPDSELISFSASVSNSAEFEWVKEHEFRYNGSLYDIIRTSSGTEGDIWHCINDTQEERILQHLKQQIHQQNGQPAKNAKVLLKSIVKDYLVNDFLVVTCQVQSIAVYAPFQETSYTTDAEPHFPPPRV